ncbi:MAG: hypothetical protein FWD27_06440 [Coriobacteriia bacterium]|nr:hypothetical protein [Coriobacteriia bacterium]
MNTSHSAESLFMDLKKLENRARESIYTRLHQSNTSPCFVLAPRKCGLDELIIEYQTALPDKLSVTNFELASCSSGSLAQWALDSHSTLLKPAKTQGACLEEGDAPHRLAFITFVPWLDDDAAKRLSNEIDDLLVKGFRVVVLCPVQNDRYTDLQSDRAVILASELKDAGYFAPALHGECLRQFSCEYLPVQIRLAAILCTVLGQTTLDELVQLGYTLSHDVPKLLEQLHPLFERTSCNKGIKCQQLLPQHFEQELIRVIGEYLEETRQPFSATSVASRIAKLSVALLEKGNLESSHQLLEFAETLIKTEAYWSDTHNNTYSAIETSAGRAAGRLINACTSQQTVQGSVDLPLLKVQLFGRMEIRIGNDLVQDKFLARTKLKRFLAFMVLNQHRVVSRDTLIEYLWPSLDFERAQKNLYTNWCLLSKGLGADKVRDCPYLMRSGEVYQLRSELVLSDTEQFESLARALLFEQNDLAGQTRSILELEALYRDSLVGDIPADNFLSAKMASFRGMMVDTLLLVARHLRSEGEFERALFCIRSAYELDETREDVYRDLMNTQYEAGQRTSAMQTYFTCKQYLADELGILPSKRTTALYQELLLDSSR